MTGCAGSSAGLGGGRGGGQGTAGGAGSSPRPGRPSSLQFPFVAHSSLTGTAAGGPLLSPALSPLPPPGTGPRHSGALVSNEADLSDWPAWGF